MNIRSYQHSVYPIVLDATDVRNVAKGRRVFAVPEMPKPEPSMTDADAGDTVVVEGHEALDELPLPSPDERHEPAPASPMTRFRERFGRGRG